MDHAAIFIDAGYLLAASARLLTGSRSRSEIDVSYPSLIQHLIAFTEQHSGLALLRTYWYDGAPDAVPVPEQLVIGRLPNVKVRLGRRTQHGQKGVDSLIVIDMVTLALARAMSRAYLLSGDEDIREGVAFAQHRGVRVVLIGVPNGDGRPNQADSLIREADEQLILDSRTAIAPFISPRRVAIAGVPPDTAPMSAHELGRQFGKRWMELATATEAVVLRTQAPAIPTELDAQLFRHAETTLGPLRARQDERRALRAGFWEAVMTDVERLAPVP